MTAVYGKDFVQTICHNSRFHDLHPGGCIFQPDILGHIDECRIDLVTV